MGVKDGKQIFFFFFFLPSTSVPARVLAELSALVFPHVQTSGKSYLTGILQSVIHVCEILGVAKTKSARSTAGAPELSGKWIFKETLGEDGFY